MVAQPGDKKLYDTQKRGTKAPDYSDSEIKYRSKNLDRLQQAYQIREQTHQEFNDKTYSENYLINRQQDMAYNPPKRNRADTRLVSGIIHEKDNTILSLLTSMNLQPKVRVFDKENKEMKDASHIFTAIIKNSLIRDDFREKQVPIFRTNIAQGNAFVKEQREVKLETKKVLTKDDASPDKKKWKTVVKEVDHGCTSVLIPNTGVFLSNILEDDLDKQPEIWYSMHIPLVDVAQKFSKFKNWDAVPKYPSRTVPVNVDGVWGDYFLQRPSDQYVEVIVYESQPKNEYNVFLNGVMMYPVQNEGGIMTGYPLTEVSPSGKYSLVKGDNERIPFFAYGKSVPAKNEVKEETMNELMRLMVYKMRQAAKPPVGNNTTKVLQANIWDPGVITPDVSSDDISILTPNAGITSADFSFYNLIQNSISESSVSPSVEGTNQAEITATQFVDQKKANLKKLGLSVDNAIAMLKKIYWLRLYNEIDAIDKKVKRFNPDTGKLEEALRSFSIDENVDGGKGTTRIDIVDEVTMDSKQFDELEQASEIPTRIFQATPKALKKIIKTLKDKIYIDVVSEPDGQEQALIGVMFNLMTQYANLKGSPEAINFKAIEKLINDNSGFEATELFIDAPVQPQVLGGQQPGISPEGGSQPSFRGPAERPKAPANNILATANS